MMKMKLLIILSVASLMFLLIGCGKTFTPIGMDSEVSPTLSTQEKIDKANKTLAEIKKDIPQEFPPITFKKAWLTTNSINNPEARITFKNTSTKIIDAIKISIICFDNFNKPTSSNGDIEFHAINQKTINPNTTIDDKWTLYMHENTTKFTAILKEIHFTDGTTWNSDSNTEITIES